MEGLWARTLVPDTFGGILTSAGRVFEMFSQPEIPAATGEFFDSGVASLTPYNVMARFIQSRLRKSIA